MPPGRQMYQNFFKFSSAKKGLLKKLVEKMQEKSSVAGVTFVKLLGFTQESPVPAMNLITEITKGCI